MLQRCNSVATQYNELYRGTPRCSAARHGFTVGRIGFVAPALGSFPPEWISECHDASRQLYERGERPLSCPRAGAQFN
jgi:hypothetical protein